MNVRGLKFPQLAPRYHGMPRRYEETKPVVIQNFTHRSIVGIGHEFQRRLLDRLEREKTETVKAAEDAVWEEANKRKDEELKRVRNEGVEWVQQRLEEEHKLHEQYVKEECAKVEMAMQKVAIEQVQQERAKAERVLRETVQKVEERCEKQLQQTVAEARKQEQHIAAGKRDQIIKKHTVEVEKLKEEAKKDKAKAIADLTATCKQELEVAVKEANETEQKIAKEKLEMQKKDFEAVLQIEYKKIVEYVLEIEDLKAQIESLQKEKQRVADYLMATRRSFQDFINHLKKFYPGQSDYMIPPAYLEEIERGLMIAE